MTVWSGKLALWCLWSQLSCAPSLVHLSMGLGLALPISSSPDPCITGMGAPHEGRADLCVYPGIYLAPAGAE